MARSLGFDTIFGMGKEQLARKLLERGELDKAEEAFVTAKLWQEAARVALKRRDVTAAARYLAHHCLGAAARDFDTAEADEIAGVLASSDHGESALTLYEHLRDWEAAGRLAQSLERHERAARLFERGGHWQEAADCWQQLGRDDELLRALSEQLSAMAESRYSSSDPALHRAARELDLRRAEVLRRLGRDTESRRLFDAWIPVSIEEIEAQRGRVPPIDLVEACLRLGELEAGRRLYRELGLSVPSLEQKLAGNDAAPEAEEKVGSPVETEAEASPRPEPPKPSESSEPEARVEPRQAPTPAPTAEASAAPTALEVEAPVEVDPIEALERRMNHSPDEVATSERLVDTLLASGAVRRLLAVLDRLPSASAGSKADAVRRYGRARALEALSRDAEAAVLYEQVLEQHGGYRDAHERLSECSSTRSASRSSAASTTDEAPAPEPGQELGPGAILNERWEILDVLGMGGMACVYRAQDRELDEVVAIKTLRRSGPGQSEDEERLLREVQICRRLSHPNIVRVHDVGRFESGLFVTMEFIEGLALDALMALRQAPARVHALTTQIVAGLGEAHAAGVVHRDLKPGNLMISMDRVKIVDFGIAHALGPQDHEGKVVGSPLYMAPEQFRREPLDGRTDLYALGVVVFALLTGREPYLGRDLSEVARAHLEQPIPRIATLREDLDPSWQELVDRLLAKDPSERFDSAQSVGATLAAFDEGALSSR
jgi:serine/threonine-protein kinase